jgi:hypothetical protein
MGGLIQQNTPNDDFARGRGMIAVSVVTSPSDVGPTERRRG